MITAQGHDHPAFDQLLPRIGCQICNAYVQAVPVDRSRVRAAYQTYPDTQAARELREQFEAPMGRWSVEHANTHLPEEHEEQAARAAAAAVASS